MSSNRQLIPSNYDDQRQGPVSALRKVLTVLQLGPSSRREVREAHSAEKYSNPGFSSSRPSWVCDPRYALPLIVRVEIPVSAAFKPSSPRRSMQINQFKFQSV